MAAGLFDDHVDPESAMETRVSNSVSVGKPVKVETKTTQQRNKEKLRKKKQALDKAAKETRILNNELFR
jgi:hypothetical protein